MFSDINISQGSVATPLMCGGICNNLFIANFLLSVTVKEFFLNVPNSLKYPAEYIIYSLLFWATLYAHGISTLQTDERTTYDIAIPRFALCASRGKIENRLLFYEVMTKT